MVLTYVHKLWKSRMRMVAFNWFKPDVRLWVNAILWEPGERRVALKTLKRWILETRMGGTAWWRWIEMTGHRGMTTAANIIIPIHLGIFRYQLIRFVLVTLVFLWIFLTLVRSVFFAFTSVRRMGLGLILSVLNILMVNWGGSLLPMANGDLTAFWLDSNFI